MSTGADVMMLLCPNVEYTIYGDNYSSINWFDKKAVITEAEFKAGFAQCDALKAQQSVAKAAARQAVLDKLGLTADEVAALLN